MTRPTPRVITSADGLSYPSEPTTLDGLQLAAATMGPRCEISTREADVQLGVLIVRRGPHTLEIHRAQGGWCAEWASKNKRTTVTTDWPGVCEEILLAECLDAPSWRPVTSASYWPRTVDRIECDECGLPFAYLDQVKPVAFAHMECPVALDDDQEQVEVHHADVIDFAGRLYRWARGRGLDDLRLLAEAKDLLGIVEPGAAPADQCVVKLVEIAEALAIDTDGRPIADVVNDLHEALVVPLPEPPPGRPNLLPVEAPMGWNRERAQAAIDIAVQGNTRVPPDARQKCGCLMGARWVTVEHCGGHAFPMEEPVPDLDAPPMLRAGIDATDVTRRRLLASQKHGTVLIQLGPGCGENATIEGAAATFRSSHAPVMVLCPNPERFEAEAKTRGVLIRRFDDGKTGGVYQVMGIAPVRLADVELVPPEPEDLDGVVQATDEAPFQVSIDRLAAQLVEDLAFSSTAGTVSTLDVLVTMGGLGCARANRLYETEVPSKTPTLVEGYPPDWPRCPGCSRPALDGHITCGDVRCDEGGHRG